MTESWGEEVSRKTVLGLAEVCRAELAGCVKSMWLVGEPLFRAVAIWPIMPLACANARSYLLSALQECFPSIVTESPCIARHKSGKEQHPVP